MPKQVLKIDRFEGGINNNADPRDIPDNALAACTDVVVDNIGRILMMGEFETHESGDSAGQEYNQTMIENSDNEENKGTGLFTYSMDYQMLNADGNVYNNDLGSGTDFGDTPEKPSHYLAIYDTSKSASYSHHVSFYQRDAFGSTTDWNEQDTEANIVGLGGTAGGYLSYYFARGGLRVTDALDLASNVTKWRGIIKPKNYGFYTDTASVYNLHYLTGTANTPLFYTTNAEIAPCFPEDEYDGTLGNTKVCINAIMANTHDSDGGTGEARGFGFADETCETGTGPEDVSSLSETDMYWGVGLEFDEGANGSGTWQVDAKVKYQFHISTVYDEGTQESATQLMSMYPSTQLHTNDDYVGHTPETEIQFTNNDAHDDVDHNGVEVFFKPVIKCNGAKHTAVGNAPDATNVTNFNFGAANETVVTDTGNRRISGVRIYWSSNEDGHSQLWRLFDCDFNLGVKPYGMSGALTSSSSGYAPWIGHRQFPFSDFNIGDSTDYSSDDDGSAGNHNENHFYFTPGWYLTENAMANPPKVLSYFTANGHRHNDETNLISFKTAVVANQRTYVGNVRQKTAVGDNKAGHVIHYGDRLMKSPVGQYDKFPSSQFIDVVTEDGESIHHLASFADRILQFKDKTLYIINISKAQEYLESQHKGLGVTNGCQVATTDIGVAWANKNGVYFYNGGRVINLFEKNGESVISKTAWDTFTNSGAYTPVVGYIQDKKQLLIQQDFDTGGGGQIYIYDFVTKSFVHGSAGKAWGDNTPTSVSNMVNDWNADTIQAQYNSTGDVIQKWTSSARGSSNVEIKTKDFDFGAPAVRKKIYKIYITHKGAASNIQCAYAVNGTGSFTNIGSELPASSPTTAWVTTEIALSISSCYSVQLKLSSAGATPASFQINDISIIYRMKAIK